MRAGAFLRVLGLGVLVFGAAWLAAIVYWRANAVEVTAGGLLAWLLVLPLALFASVLWIRALLRRRRGRTAGVERPSTGDTEGSASPEPDPDDRPLYLHAAAVRTRAGSDPAEVAAALVRPARPPLHRRLRDSMGLPVFAAEVDDDADPERVAGLLAGTATGVPPRVLRAVSLLDGVVEELFVAAQALLAVQARSVDPAPDAGPGLHPHALHHSRSAQAPADTRAVSPMPVHLLVPADWPPPLHDAAAARVAEVARITGVPAGAFEVRAEPAQSAAGAWRALERIAAVDADREMPRLLLATESLLDPATVERLEAGGQLLVSGHLEGRIPGEAAAGLLLTGSPLTGADPEPVRVHRISRCEAGKGRAAAVASTQLLQEALGTAELDGGAAVVFTDADHRPSRAVEAAGAVEGLLPGEEPEDTARHLGLACGDAGLAAPLVLLALAAAHVRGSALPSLVLGVADDRERVAIALSPPNKDV